MNRGNRKRRRTRGFPHHHGALEREHRDGANELIRSLGFDPQTWEGEGAASWRPGDRRVFGMNLPVSEKLQEAGVWECRIEKRAEGHLLVINDAAVAASCTNLTDLTPLAGLTQLTTLDLAGCKNLTDTSGGLTQLTSFDLAVCENLTDITHTSGGADAADDVGFGQLHKPDRPDASGGADAADDVGIGQLHKPDRHHTSGGADATDVVG